MQQIAFLIHVNFIHNEDDSVRFLFKVSKIDGLKAARVSLATFKAYLKLNKLKFKLNRFLRLCIFYYIDNSVYMN